ncbi:hypothetical protein AB0D34_42870 [Streptomyces sp. NPDC048420]|uniref:hypothetical protein n=1 Tax=Streptomyces sp. NPDC048420 TaxID=3155755 RepID=UPI00343B834D
MYTEGEPAESLSEASSALTYGAYAVEVPPDSEEHPAVARANRQVTAAIGFRKLRMHTHPLS